MEVILFQNVQNLGTQGSVAHVSPGFFRNYLSPHGLAVEATEGNKKQLHDKLRRLEKLSLKEKDAAKSEAEKLEQMTLTFKLRAGEDDRLFGSVTNANIAEELKKNGYEIDRHRISIPEPIKRLGLFTVQAKIHHEVLANIKVMVEKEEE